MRRILFVAEAVTLSQVVRLAALARSLPERFEVHFASARFDELVFGGTRFRRWPIRSISAERAARSVAWGLPLYGRRTLARYFDDDRRVIDAVEPDVIVGDLRWSLAVSGPVSGVPVVALANAHWSPHVARERWPLPDHPLVRLLGERLVAPHYARALPAVFRRFAAPLDALRARHALAPLGSLPEVLSWGDVTLYADPPGLHALGPLPPSQRLIGPVSWAPDAPFEPPPSTRPLVYATMGSSGNPRALPIVLEALATMPVDVLVATAGARVDRLPANARAVQLARGDRAARAAAVVVCNGGASTAHQALAEGTPVVGLPWNLDQYLAMEAIERASAGVLVRSGSATAALVRSAIERACELRQGARALAARMRLLDPHRELLAVLDELAPAAPAAHAV